MTTTMQVIPNPAFPIKIIFEDESIIVIDKPAGMPCYRTKQSNKRTVTDEIGFKLSPSPHPSPSRGEGEGGGDLVHRLDNNTSGLLLAAKNQQAIDALRKQFDDNKILKRYTALVLGETPQEGVIETPIIHDPRNKKKMKISPLTGQHAHTTYKLLKKYAGGQYSLLEVTIKTGVRHQIRIHLASLGHPIAGDRLYQNRRMRERDKTGLTRQFLHASCLGFNHPSSGKWMDFSAPLPKDLQNVLTKL
jgi:23S rRNA pseudouridine1911/1915/1917 synthase